MRMRVPITGTVREIDPFISGELNDPIRMIRINLGDVSWRLIHLDLENEEMVIRFCISFVVGFLSAVLLHFLFG